MKRSIVILFLLLPAAGQAQNHGEIDRLQMMRMVEQARKMQTCMKQVDQGRLQELEKRSQQVEREIQDLCAQGRRDQAQEKALAFVDEMRDHQELQQVQKCTEMMEGMLPEMPFDKYMEGKSLRESGAHVCDG